MSVIFDANDPPSLGTRSRRTVSLEQVTDTPREFQWSWGFQYYHRSFSFFFRYIGSRKQSKGLSTCGPQNIFEGLPAYSERKKNDLIIIIKEKKRKKWKEGIFFFFFAKAHNYISSKNEKYKTPHCEEFIKTKGILASILMNIMTFQRA